MPDREFIHASLDLASTLTYAFDSGMQVMLNTDQPIPRPCILAPPDVVRMTRGDFFLFRPDWVFGPFQTMTISGGHNLGKYFVQPRVNFSSIAVFFNGERIDQGQRRFGSGVVSCHRDWLELPAKVVHSTPPDIKVWFKRIVAHLSSGFVVKAGVHKYRICKGVIADPDCERALPPFDFIPWSSEICHCRNLKRGERA